LAEPNAAVISLDEVMAKTVGELCDRQGVSDVVDASVAVCARLTGSVVITSDAADLRRLDPRLSIETI
jgi:hypothetical protein